MNSSEIESKQNPELSVVILCYKAEELAREFVSKISKELRGEGIRYELVLVGNYIEGSDDKTPVIIQQIAQNDPRCRPVVMKKQGMMGWDMRSGIQAATGDNIAIIDGDAQMPTSDVVKVYTLLRVGKYDMVKTFRARRYDGHYRQFISFWYNLIFRLLFRSTGNFRDINSKPKVMTRSAYNKLHLTSNDWFADAEMMIQALENNFNIGEVSTEFYANDRRKSFVPFSAIFEFIKNILAYKLRMIRRHGLRRVR